MWAKTQKTAQAISVCVCVWLIRMDPHEMVVETSINAETTSKMLCFYIIASLNSALTSNLDVS